MTTTLYSVQILPEGSEHRFAVVELVCEAGGAPTKRVVGLAADYDAVMKFVPDGLEWRDRDPRDPPSIVETWEPPAPKEGEHVSSEP